MELTLVDALIRQAPWAVALISLVVIFLRHISASHDSRDMRDAALIESIREIADGDRKIVKECSNVIRENTLTIGASMELMRKIDRKVNGE